MTISVLYIHHAGAFGGASRSLLELIQGFPEGAVTSRLLVPRGNVAHFFAAAGVQVTVTAGISQFDNTRYGHYRGKRWLLVLRDACLLPFTVLAMLKMRWQFRDIDIIHVNELVALPSIVLAKTLFRKPVVVHVRSVQRDRDKCWREWLVRHVLENHADAIIAIDETVRRSLDTGLACEVIHNSFSPRGALSKNTTLGDGSRHTWSKTNRMCVGIVGNLLPLKGAFEFVQAARQCRDRGQNIEFLIVGGNTRRLTGITGWLLERSGFARDVEAQIKAYIAQHDLGDTVHMLGFTPDIDNVYRKLDLLCFPSHLDAVGRPVYEAAFWRIPSIVAIRSPLPDTMIDHETGLCIEPGNIEALADAINYFYTRPEEIHRMGDAAFRLANMHCDSQRNAARVLDVYRRLIGRRRGGLESC